MSLRTPSKIVDITHQFPYIVRFVTHGGAIRYSNIVKNLNRKPLRASMAVPSGFNTITHIGFTSYEALGRYPNLNKGSEYQLINSLPPSLITQMLGKGEIIQGDNVIMKDGVVLTMFVYEYS